MLGPAMKTLAYALAIFVGLPILIVANLFLYMRSANWRIEDYDNLVTYETYTQASDHLPIHAVIQPRPDLEALTEAKEN